VLANGEGAEVERVHLKVMQQPWLLADRRRVVDRQDGGVVGGVEAVDADLPNVQLVVPAMSFVSCVLSAQVQLIVSCQAMHPVGDARMGILSRYEFVVIPTCKTQDGCGMRSPDRQGALGGGAPQDDPAVRITSQDLGVGAKEDDRVDLRRVAAKDVGWLCRRPS
jgi:hypothetical protein